VELGQNLDRQAQAPPGGQKLTMIGQRPDEIPAELKYSANFALDDALGSLDAIEPLIHRGLKPVELLEPVVRHELRLFGDADRALALDIGMAADRQDAGTGPANIAAQQQQVDQHLDILDAADLLGQPHSV